MDDTHRVAEAMTRQVRSSLTRIYLLVAASTLVGIGAAAAVYLLLR
jgi:hypothetical protein